MVNMPFLPGSPDTTAICTPLGRLGGPSIHLRSGAFARDSAGEAAASNAVRGMRSSVFMARAPSISAHLRARRIAYVAAAAHFGYRPALPRHRETMRENASAFVW